MKTRFILLILLSGVAVAQSAGTFSATGSMTMGRQEYTATLLPDGKVLIPAAVSHARNHEQSVELPRFYLAQRL